MARFASEAGSFLVEAGCFDQVGQCSLGMLSRNLHRASRWPRGAAENLLMSQCAFIEFGSTTIKYYLLEDDGCEICIQEEIKVPWKLGHEVFGQSAISLGTIHRALASIEELKGRFPNVPLLYAVGTAALREAENAADFERAVWNRLQLKIRGVDGGVEASALETGFKKTISEYPSTLFDLGGGSLEIVELESPSRTIRTSLPVGAIRFHCMLNLNPLIGLSSYATASHRLLKRVCLEHGWQRANDLPLVFATGGTAQTIAQIAESATFDREVVRRIIDDIQHVRSRSDIAPHRRQVLLAGALIVDGLFEEFEVDAIEYRKIPTRLTAFDWIEGAPTPDAAREVNG